MFQCRLKVVRIAHTRVPTFDPATGLLSGSRITTEHVVLETLPGAVGWTPPEHLAFTSEDPTTFEHLTEGVELTLEIN